MTEECDLYKVSNCCGASFSFPGWPDNDLCTGCWEHAVPGCDGCEEYDECLNEEKWN